MSLKREDHNMTIITWNNLLTSTWLMMIHLSSSLSPCLFLSSWLVLINQTTHGVLPHGRDTCAWHFFRYRLRKLRAGRAESRGKRSTTVVLCGRARWEPLKRQDMTSECFYRHRILCQGATRVWCSNKSVRDRVKRNGMQQRRWKALLYRPHPVCLVQYNSRRVDSQPVARFWCIHRCYHTVRENDHEHNANYH